MKIRVRELLRIGATATAWGAMLILSCTVRAAPETKAPAATTAPKSENKAVEASKIELAKRLNAEAGRISVFSLERIMWPDGCLGISSPGEVCSPIETPGFRVILKLGEHHYTFHTDLTGDNIRREIAGARGE